MAVPGDDLGGRHRLEPERPADVGLDRRVDVGVGPDGARELAHRDPARGPAESLAVPVGLQGPQGELGPEGGGLGVHAVGATGHRDVDQLDGPGHQAPPPARRRPPRSRSAAWTRVAHSAVSTTSDEVSP